MIICSRLSKAQGRLPEVFTVLLCFLSISCTNVVVHFAEEPEHFERRGTPSSETNVNPKVQIATEKPALKLGAGIHSQKPTLQQCDTQGTRLTIDRIKQVNSRACWAASAKMVMGFLGRHVEQCEIVDKVYSPAGVLTCCGQEKENGACRKGGWPEFAFDAYGYKSEKLSVSTSLEWNIVENEICQARPIVYAELFTQYMGHSSVISGFRKDFNDETVVYIYDHDPDRIYEEEPTDFKEIPFEEIADLDELHSLYYYVNIHKPI